VEVVLNDSGETRYLIKKNGTLVEDDKHEMPEIIYRPPSADILTWKIPRVSEVMKYVTNDNDQRLFHDLVEYHRSISELPDDNHYQFLAAWDMHTYLFDRFEYSPIIWLHAIPARGKSRTAKAMTYVSWRGIVLTNVKEAHVIRLATHHRATLFFDIMDLWKKIEKAGVEDVMLQRYEQGAKVARVMNPEKGAFRDTKWFEIYGPTIIATNREIDNILETRCIQIVMPETRKIFENDVREADALPLRERLTAFRARWIDQQLPTVAKPVASRLGDLLKPIRQIVNMVCPNERWFLDFAKDAEDQKRKDGLDNDEVKVVNAIVQALDRAENGHLLHSHIIETINDGLSERYHMSTQRLGRITKRLGFGRYNSGSARGIYIDEELLDRLCQRYGITPDGGVLTI
jgi:hypothetical protein